MGWRGLVFVFSLAALVGMGRERSNERKGEQGGAWRRRN